VNAGDSYVGDVPSATLGPLVESGKLRATADFSAVLELDTINICVPTPLRKTKDPDMSYIVSACQEIAGHFHAGMPHHSGITTYPGTTDELVLPMLSKSGLEVGRDFFLCFSPERVTRQSEIPDVNIPKVVGGCTPACTAMGQLLYSQALERVVPVSSTQVAEMVKLLENTFRMINIGLANEMALMCDRNGHRRVGSDRRRGTKPFGFMPFYPVRVWAGIAFPSIPSIFRGRPGRPASSALHRTGGYITARCPTLCRQGAERAERRGQAGKRIAHPRHGRAVQAGHRRHARIAGARRHAAAAAAAADSDYRRPYGPVRSHRTAWTRIRPRRIRRPPLQQQLTSSAGSIRACPAIVPLVTPRHDVDARSFLPACPRRSARSCTLSATKWGICR